MCSEMEQLYNEGIELGKEQGIAVGEQQGKAASEATIITNMYNSGLSPDQIALYVNKDQAEVQNIINGFNS